MITRTLFTATYKVSQLFYNDGKAEIKHLTDGKDISLTKQKEEVLLKTERKKFLLPNMIIHDLEINETVYGIELDEFMKHAVEVKRSHSQTKNKNESKENSESISKNKGNKENK